MNITLKQPEIELALRLYIGRKLDLRSSVLDVTFNMGRGDNGLAASLTITDITVPGFNDAAADEGAFHLNPAAVAGTTATAGLITPAVVDVAKVEAIVVIADAVAAIAEELLTPEPAPAEVVVEDPAENLVPTGEVEKETAVAAVATPETEAERAEPVAEAQVVEAKPTTSLFG